MAPLGVMPNDHMDRGSDTGVGNYPVLGDTVGMVQHAREPVLSRDAGLATLREFPPTLVHHGRGRIQTGNPVRRTPFLPSEHFFSVSQHGRGFILHHKRAFKYLLRDVVDVTGSVTGVKRVAPIRTDVAGREMQLRSVTRRMGR